MCGCQAGAVWTVRGVDRLNVKGEGALEPVSVHYPLCREVQAVEALLEGCG